ncbi:helix-turn-helix domain-containing protein [Arthrobacter sp. CDRTa11]|uniref:helix-turn-helix domain-containing protein n=1 Tax=Arthrobacter sp. CDRTa11 TaxID=2651199 RepID=UPI002265AE90|nr:helix-turn-helix transcriptional regulator [Arthrobacter sp. CDRTa11]UZX04026.1 helix-turn-helix domain-containing protein [Arthrobacter sp. CDRTa11]
MTAQQQVHQAEEAQFVENVQRLREAKGWSQGELARRMAADGWDGFHQTTISRIEKGQRPVRLAEARALAKVLGSQVGVMMAPPLESSILENLATSIGLMRRSRSRIWAEVDVIDRLKTSLMTEIAQVETIPKAEWERLGLWETIAELVVQASHMQKWSAQSILTEGMDVSDGIDPEA